MADNLLVEGLLVVWMKQGGKKVVIYCSATQSDDEIKAIVSRCFSQPDCRYNIQNIASQFHESLNDVKARTFSQMKAAIQYCRSDNAALLVVRDLKGKGYLESLRLLQESHLQDILVYDGSLTPQWIESEISKEGEKRERIKAGTKKALAKRKKEGMALGNPSFSLIRNSDTKAANDAKQDQADCAASTLIEEIKKLPISEQHSFNNIAKLLNQKGVTTKRGRPIHRGTIRRAFIRVKENR